MSHLIIEGSSTLDGSIPVYGSKNAALPLLAATLLTSEEVTLENMPPIADVDRLTQILQSIGCDVQQDGTQIKACAQNLDTSNIPVDIIRKLRGSILLLGALLGRSRKAAIPLPGGDIIGARPIDAHLDGFRQLGAQIHEGDKTVSIDGSSMKAGTVVLKEFSVTATENMLLACSTLPGTSTIHIAAAEPHVKALADILDAMGARIEGAGTHTITIEGSRELHAVSFTNTPDMLEAGLFILLGAATRSEITVEHVPIDHLHLFFKKLDDIGIQYKLTDDTPITSVTVQPGNLTSFTMQSLPYPGIPTDLQAPFAVIATQAQGSSLIHDPLYEDRFKHVAELQKMGADAVICDPHRVIITGPTVLKGRRIPSLDIRSGASLVVAGLVAEGRTIIDNAEIIDRGYANLTKRLQALGANISREGDG